MEVRFCGRHRRYERLSPRAFVGRVQAGNIHGNKIVPMPMVQPSQAQKEPQVPVSEIGFGRILFHVSSLFSIWRGALQRRKNCKTDKKEVVILTFEPISMITRQNVLSRLGYDPVTGRLWWKVPKRGHNIGRCAGATDNKGYINIGIDGTRYKAHRLIWLIETGSFPDKSVPIDHINMIKDDNRFCNLRLATNSQNKMNSTRIDQSVYGGG